MKKELVILYSYVNEDFDRLLTPPELLFEYPLEVSYIDSDVIRVGDRYHMFYTPHDGVGGVKQAVSERANGGYVYHPEWCDPEAGACEGPTVWKRIGEQKWVLMYDVFSARPNNMGFSETTDFVNFTDLGHFNDGVMRTTNFTSPKHGAVVHLTAKEANRLAEHWGLDMKF